MPKEIIRIGVYWFPPEPLKTLLERTWRGELNRYKACELVARHCGDCPVWGAHATLLDAITILAEDKQTFIDRIGAVLKEFGPVTLRDPVITKRKERAHNVYIVWKDDAERFCLNIQRSCF
jgi:hypothetical protein